MRGRSAKLARTAIVGSALMVLSAGPALAGARPSSPPDHVRRATLTHAQNRPSKLWKARFDGSGSLANDIATSPDGATVFVTGVTSPPNTVTPDYETIAYDASSGAQLWAASYDGPGQGDDSAASISVSPDGATVYVTGSSAGDGTGADYATVAYDALTGDQLWVARYDGTLDLGDSASNVTVSPDGGSVFVTGTSAADDRFFTVFTTVGYDAATGAERWVARYAEAHGTNQAHGVAVSPDGARVFVTGTSPGFGTADDYATIAYDASTGSQEWVARFDGGGFLTLDFAQSIAVAPDGSAVAVTGTSDNNYGTVAYDQATGSQLWAATYRRTGDTLAIPHDLAVDPGSRTVYVTGQTCCSTGSNDIGTIAYDLKTGDQLWVAEYDFNGLNDSPSSIVVSPNGASVFVAGTETIFNDVQEWATVGYVAATGQQRQVTTIGRGYPIGMAVSPDGGRLFVTGTIAQGNYGTVGYQLR